MPVNKENLLNRHLADLLSQSGTAFTYTYSQFLSLAEQEDFIKYALSNKLCVLQATGLPSGFTFYGGSETAERRICVFGSASEFGYEPDYPVRVMEILPLSEKFAENLSHRDYLGAILNLGIDRSLTGDIIVRETRAYIFCMESICDFLAENLSRIRHTSVSCRQISENIPELAPSFELLNINCASERLDAIIAEFASLSRAKAAALISGEKVSVNGRIITSTDFHLKVGDILSVRGIGKAIYDGISHDTRKGRHAMQLRKFV